MADRQRGSVLVLLPVSVLVFLILGALAVDFGLAWSAERQLANAAAAAANDAASRGLDLDHLYATGEVRLATGRLWEIAERSVAAHGLGRIRARVAAVEVDGAAVRVTVAGRAPYLFARAVPGGPDGVDVEASAEVTAEEVVGG